MNTLHLACITIALSAALPTLAADPEPASAKLVKDRPYSVEVPSSYDGSTPTPAVLVLPGFTNDAFDQEEYFKLGRAALARGVLLVLVSGTRNPDGNPFWNATDACCDFYRQGPDDVAYLDAVLDDLARRFRVDTRRVWLVGHSNGGFMAHRYACERSRRVAGFVSLAGAGWFDPARCRPEVAVAALQVHGDADSTIRPGGGTLDDPEIRRHWSTAGIALPKELNLTRYPAARASLEPWRRKGGCGPTAVANEPLDLDTKLPGAETTVERWPGCRGGAVELWTIRGGGHGPDLAPDWGERILGFLADHPKP
jgi:polyhydroxybutyrate depolymerase